MSTTTIYQPRGKAFEYSPLALNLYKGCTHGCEYCFAPKATFTDRSVFYSEEYVKPRPNILEKAERDAMVLKGDERPILMSFTSDVYQPCEEKYGITRQALKIMKKYNLRPTILTKAGKLPLRDIDILQTIPNAVYAATLTCWNHTEWEPGAAPTLERIKTLEEMHKAGIKTWVSFEPVVNPKESLEIMEYVAPFCDFYKIGVLNYHEKAKEIDWVKFRSDSVAMMEKLNKPYLLKEDLLKK